MNNIISKLIIFITLFFGVLNLCHSNSIYLICQVEGMETVMLGQGYGVDETRLGPVAITVNVEDATNFIHIKISGPRPFNNTSAFFEKNKILTKSNYGFVTNEIFKVGESYQGMETSIEINRISAQIIVSEKSDINGIKGRVNFSGFCSKKQNQQF